MEKVFWVIDGHLDEVNAWLQKGGRVKTIVAVPNAEETYKSVAYIVIEFD